MASIQIRLIHAEIDGFYFPYRSATSTQTVSGSWKVPSVLPFSCQNARQVGCTPVEDEIMKQPVVCSLSVAQPCTPRDAPTRDKPAT